MSLTRSSVRIVRWMPTEEMGRTVKHLVEHHRDDQYPSLCGALAFEVIAGEGGDQCVECMRRLLKPTARRGRLLEDPDR